MPFREYDRVGLEQEINTSVDELPSTKFSTRHGENEWASV